jgi:cellulose biosynthesis protein BcsQ
MRALKLPPANRILIVTGHYGSGKTEFSVSLAMRLARAKTGERLAVIDMDIANPYFRSRERRGTLEEAGIEVFGSLYDKEITAELPALGARLRAPLENKSYRVIVDAGGNDSGALVLNQFKKYFTPETSTTLAVVNFSRYETQNAETAAAHIAAIEYATGLRVEYLVNNTHLLRETTAETVARGHRLAMEVCEKTDKRLFCDCYPAPVVREAELFSIGENPFPLGLYMRPTWLDR